MSKTYTFTWKDSFSWNRTKLHRRRVCYVGGSFIDSLDWFLWTVTWQSMRFPNRSDFRLTRCGRLVARSATYQGV